MNLMLASHQSLLFATLPLIATSLVMLAMADRPDEASDHESVESPRPLVHTLQSLNCMEKNIK